MSRALWVLLGVAAVTATLAGQGGAASTASPGDGKAKAEAADGAAGAYEELLLARAPLLLEVRLLRARRRLFEVAADPQKGEQLERDIKAAFARVVALYERYLKEHPDDARAHYGFGVLCYWEGEDERRAEAHWLRTIELDPGYDLAHNALAVHYADAGEPDKALKHISKALSLNPGVAMYHFNAATFYFNFRKPAMRMFGWDLGRCWQKVTSEYEEALRLAPGNYVFARDYAQSFYFAVHFKVEPDYSRAREVWGRALALAPSTWERVMVLTNLARVSCFVGDRDAARGYLDQALTLNPGNPVALRLQRKMAEDEPGPEPAAKRPGGDRSLPPAPR